MRKQMIAITVAALFAGVAVPAQAQDALGGALIGAGTGAIIGGAVKGGKGAAVGAAIGGVTGAAIGANTERRRVRVYDDRARAQYIVRERRSHRVRTCWRNDFGERVCRYR